MAMMTAAAAETTRSDTELCEYSTTSNIDARWHQRRLFQGRCEKTMHMPLSHLLLRVARPFQSSHATVSSLNQEDQPWPDDDGHLLAPVQRDRIDRLHAQVHLSGTSRRHFVHVYLWWAVMLGSNYPIGETLLSPRLAQQLRSVCGCGLSAERVVRLCGPDAMMLDSATPVCIHPRHYTLAYASGSALAFELLCNDVVHLCDELDWMMAKSMRTLMYNPERARARLGNIASFVTQARAIIASFSTCALHSDTSSAEGFAPSNPVCLAHAPSSAFSTLVAFLREHCTHSFSNAIKMMHFLSHT